VITDLRSSNGVDVGGTRGRLQTANAEKEGKKVRLRYRQSAAESEGAGPLVMLTHTPLGGGEKKRKKKRRDPTVSVMAPFGQT